MPMHRSLDAVASCERRALRRWANVSHRTWCDAVKPPCGSASVLLVQSPTLPLPLGKIETRQAAKIRVAVGA
jgi:hypothetical protein